MVDNDHISKEILIAELKKKDKIIKQLKEDLHSLKNIVTDNAFTGSREIKIIPMNIHFVDYKSGKTIICEKTNIACWWDTYTFDTLPCFIPEKYYDGKYFVFGCFCSYSCAAAYNLYDNCHKYKISDRHSLIEQLNGAITNSSYPIEISPRKEILKKYGGELTIEEFRALLKVMNKEYKLLLPPMVNLIPCIEEKTKDKYIEKSSVPDIKKISINEKDIIPTKKKILHDGNNLNIVDTIGITEEAADTIFYR